MSESHPLERLLRPHDAPVVADDSHNAPFLEDSVGAVVHALCGDERRWLTCGDWRLFTRTADPIAAGRGEPLLSFSGPDGSVLHVTRDPDGGVTVPFGLADAYQSYISEAWRDAGELKRLSSRQLSAFYRIKHLVPRAFQLAARRALIRWQGRPGFPSWPLDTSVTQLLKLYARCLIEARGDDGIEFTWFWPDPYRSALILTHDVESEAGLRLAVELADLEETRGFRSSFNIVADWYPIDRGIVRELTTRGFEIGLHGIHHDRSMFASRDSFESQQPAIRDALEDLGAVGFRSPATHRVFEWLGELPVSYDCTMPHSDPYEPKPGGCCSVWPFFIGSLVELPYTMPQDHTLFTLLRQRSIAMWRSQFERIDAAGGLTQVVTHPDPGYLGDDDKRRLYVAFLDHVRAREGVWHTLPREAAEWWRARDARDGARWRPATGRAVLDRSCGRVSFERSIEQRGECMIP